MWKYLISSEEQDACCLLLLTNTSWLSLVTVLLPVHRQDILAQLQSPSWLLIHITHADRNLSTSSRKDFSLPSLRLAQGTMDHFMLAVLESFSLEALGIAKLCVFFSPRQWVELIPFCSWVWSLLPATDVFLYRTTAEKWSGEVLVAFTFQQSTLVLSRDHSN